MVKTLCQSDMRLWRKQKICIEGCTYVRTIRKHNATGDFVCLKSKTRWRVFENSMKKEPSGHCIINCQHVPIDHGGEMSYRSPEGGRILFFMGTSCWVGRREQGVTHASAWLLKEPATWGGSPKCRDDRTEAEVTESVIGIAYESRWVSPDSGLHRFESVPSCLHGPTCCSNSCCPFVPSKRVVCSTYQG